MKESFILALLLLLSIAVGLLLSWRYMEKSERTQTYQDTLTALNRCETAADVCTNMETDAKRACDAAKEYRDEARAIHDCVGEMQLRMLEPEFRPIPHLVPCPTSQPFATEFAKAVAKCENIADLKAMIENAPTTHDPQARTGETTRPEGCENGGGF